MRDITKVLSEKNLNPQSKKISSSLQSWMNENVLVGFEIECYAPEEFRENIGGGYDYDSDPDIVEREASNTLTDIVDFSPPNKGPYLFDKLKAEDILKLLEVDVPIQIRRIGRNDLFGEFDDDLSNRQRNRFAEGIFDSGEFYDFYRELIEKQQLYIESLDDDFEKDEDTEYSPVDESDLERLATFLGRDLDGLTVRIEDIERETDSWTDSAEYYDTTVDRYKVRVRTTVYQERLVYPEVSSGSEFDEYEIQNLLNSKGLDSDLFTIESDGSLRKNEGGVEIILSKPLPYAEAFEIYEKLTHILKNNDFIVDSSTGMHMSFSVKGLKSLDEVNWLKVLVLSGSDYIQKSFGRLNNQYVDSLNKTLQTYMSTSFNPNSAEFRKLEDSVVRRLSKSEVGMNKYVNLNLRDFSSYRGRIEYRVPGGKDSLNYEKVKQSVDRVIVAVYYGMKQNENLYHKEYIKKLYNLTAEITGKRLGTSKTPKMTLAAYAAYKKSLMAQTIRAIEVSNNTLKGLYNTQYTTNQFSNAFPSDLNIDFLHVFFNGIDRELLKVEGTVPRFDVLLVPRKAITIIKERMQTALRTWFNTASETGTIFYSASFRAVTAKTKLSMTYAYNELSALLDYYVERVIEIFDAGDQPIEPFADFIRRYNT